MYFCLQLHLALQLRRSKSVSQPPEAFFVEVLRWIRLFGQAGVRVFNDLSVRQASQMIESLKSSSAN